MAFGVLHRFLPIIPLFLILFMRYDLYVLGLNCLWGQHEATAMLSHICPMLGTFHFLGILALPSGSTHAGVACKASLVGGGGPCLSWLSLFVPSLKRLPRAPLSLLSVSSSAFHDTVSVSGDPAWVSWNWGLCTGSPLCRPRTIILQLCLPRQQISGQLSS